MVFSLVITSCEEDDVFTDEFEENNSISTAYEIEQGEIYNAYIAENDADFFSFTTTNGSTTFDELEISV
ncbi:MAG: hypothetical protein ACLFUC_03205, partial [Bacteroidales bacterium]